jgi:hypothetical protein
LRGVLTQLLPARVQEFTEIIERAKARGELRADLDVDLVLSLVAGAIFYHWFLGGIVAPMPPPAQLAEQLVYAIFRGIANAR